MGQIGVGAGAGALQGALGGAPYAGATGGWSIIVGAIVGAALGAGVSALSMALADKGPKSQRRGVDWIQTTSIRYAPVVVCFGRCRVGGNWISVGTFAITTDEKDGTKGRRIRRVRGVLALCEGVVQAAGNIRQDGQTLDFLRKSEGAPFGYDYRLYPGTNTQPTPVLDNSSGMSAGQLALLAQADLSVRTAPLIPYRFTAFMEVFAIVGERPRLPEVNVDLVGPDFTIRRMGAGSGGASDVAVYAFYDGHTEAFYYVLSDGSGVAKAPRESGARTVTAPPDDYGGDGIERAWYLGRHDVLVMQDTVDATRFFIGYWGIDPSSDDWETHTPGGPGGPYEEAEIVCWHLDEVHGILHSVHVNGDDLFYVSRWNLLTGHVERTNWPDIAIADGVAKAVLYSADFDCYVLAQAGKLSLIDPESGKVTSTSTAIASTLAECLGLCVSGQLIGVVYDGGLLYIDARLVDTYGPYGSAGTDVIAPGQLGGIVSAHQNTFTGHVTVVRNNGGVGPHLINFIPSVIEDFQDTNANGTSGLGTNPPPEEPEPDFQSPPPSDTESAWVRDWSYRTPIAYSLVSLQGNSSLAAALWAIQVDEPGLNSVRWGAGLRPDLFSLASFEGVHWYCVGGVSMVNPDGTTRRLAERYKLDFCLDAEESVASVVAEQMLIACQGYRVVIGGKLHVGIPKPGCWPIWHFSPRQTNQSGVSIKWTGRGEGINQVRVAYRDVLNEYQQDFGEDNDEWDQQQRGSVKSATFQAEGIARKPHAEALATVVLDQSIGGRRQFGIPTHYVGLMLAPTDPIEVSDDQVAVNRVRARVISRTEEVDDETTAINLVAVESRPGREVRPKRGENVPGPGTEGSSSSSSSGSAGPCPAGGPEVTATLDGEVAYFGSGGSSVFGTTFPPGDYIVSYLDGTYAPTSAWDNAVAGLKVVDAPGDVLVDAPGITIDEPGWASSEEAEAANFGQSVRFTLSAESKIGIQYTGDTSDIGPGVKEDSSDSTAPKFRLCRVSTGPALCGEAGLPFLVGFIGGNTCPCRNTGDDSWIDYTPIGWDSWVVLTSLSGIIGPFGSADEGTLGFETGTGQCDAKTSSTGFNQTGWFIQWGIPSSEGEAGFIEVFNTNSQRAAKAILRCTGGVVVVERYCTDVPCASNTIATDGECVGSSGASIIDPDDPVTITIESLA